MLCAAVWDFGFCLGIFFHLALVLWLLQVAHTPHVRVYWALHMGPENLALSSSENSSHNDNKDNSNCATHFLGALMLCLDALHYSTDFHGIKTSGLSRGTG